MCFIDLLEYLTVLISGVDESRNNYISYRRDFLPFIRSIFRQKVDIVAKTRFGCYFEIDKYYLVEGDNLLDCFTRTIKGESFDDRIIFVDSTRYLTNASILKDMYDKNKEYRDFVDRYIEQYTKSIPTDNNIYRPFDN